MDSPNEKYNNSKIKGFELRLALKYVIKLVLAPETVRANIYTNKGVENNVVQFK